MKKKKQRVFVLLLLAAAIIYTIFWIAVDFIFIPKVVIPKVREYISAANAKGYVKIFIKGIHFLPWRGFVLQDIKIIQPGKPEDSYILKAKLVDIDVAFLPLLLKQIIVERFGLLDAKLNIVRDATGIWNFQHLLGAGFTKEKETGKTNFVIKEFKVKYGVINYQDLFKSDNALRRKFTGIDITVTNPARRLYNIKLSCGTNNVTKESVNLEMNFDKTTGSIDGTVKVNTIYLQEYWDYYLDDLLKPWHLKAEKVTAKMLFSYQNDTLLLDGDYLIDDGILAYGDFCLCANAAINQKSKYIKGMPAKNITKLGLNLKDLSLLTGKYVFLEQGQSKANIVAKEVIEVENLTGIIKGRPVNLAGKYMFSEPREISLSGKIAQVDSVFHMVHFLDDHGTIDWQCGTVDSFIKMHADMSQFKNLACSLNVEADAKLQDLSGLLLLDKDKIAGKINLAGGIKGEIDNGASLQGELSIKLQDFSLFGLEPQTFTTDINVKNGIFEANIPQVDFYKGSLSGLTRFDYNRWGFELHIKNAEIEELYRQLIGNKQVKGLLSADFFCVSNWDNINQIRGAGHFVLRDCKLGDTPLFSSAAKGIGNVIKGFILPDFKNVQGNFEVKERNIYSEGFCSSAVLNLRIKGGYSFQGTADYTVGATILGGSFLKTVRQLIFPISIGFDILTNSIQVDINGKWPDLKYKTRIKPARWLDEFFGLINQIAPKKYALSDFWN